MDGLMFDTETLSRWAWQTAAKEFGVEITDRDYHSLVGKAWDVRKRALYDLCGPGFPYDKIVARRLALGDGKEEQEGVPAKPGLFEILGELDRRRLRKAVATGTDRKRALARLQRAGVLERFEVVTAHDEVPHGKPAPDIFLETARRMNLAPADCLVLEDAEVGIQSALAAGMRAIQIPDIQMPSEALLRSGCMIFSSLSELCRNLTKILDGQSCE